MPGERVNFSFIREKIWLTYKLVIDLLWLPKLLLEIETFDYLPPEVNPSTVEAPCKLSFTSKGLLGLKYGEQMGIYYLLKSSFIRGRPAWQHESGKYFLRMDGEGSWIISKVNITKTT